MNEDPGHAEPSIVTVQPRLSAREVAELQKLVEEAARHDGTYPLNEHAVLHLRGGGGPHAEHVVARAGGTMVGYGLLDSADRSPGATGELVVVPDHRRRGVGAALAEAMLAVAPAPLRLWAHGDQPAAERLAASLGFDRVRELWQMRLDLAATSLDAAPELPPRVSVRTFAPGADEGAWLEVNARAFAEHPEQGALTMDGLKARIAEPWFDPSGFFLAERDGQIVGFHWTKVHGGSGGHAHPPIGEVYVVGVDPASRGLGLGRILTVIGLRHLRQRGVHEVMLYVDADNAAGVRTYRRLGFVHHSTDVMYSQAG